MPSTDKTVALWTVDFKSASDQLKTSLLVLLSIKRLIVKSLKFANLHTYSQGRSARWIAEQMIADQP